MNKGNITQYILDNIWKCEEIEKNIPLAVSSIEDKLKNKIQYVAKAHSGSWVGYHSKVYYKNFQNIPIGACFSAEWGFKSHGDATRGDWIEYNYDKIKQFVFKDISKDDENQFQIECSNIGLKVDDIRVNLDIVLNILIESHNSPFLTKIKDELDKIKVYKSQTDYSKAMLPGSQFSSRDSEALSQGILYPPHIQISSWFLSNIHPYVALKQVSSIAKKALDYMKINDIISHYENITNGKIFIGHGRSQIWRELKDFVNDRLNLKWEEFNREPVAGITTIERLQEMLSNSSFAFLIMTAEDEHSDKSLHARENVIHEVGLFQGKLGFRKAIILFEEGCSEFSNINGLSQIRFPKGNISAKFEEIRQVLEREGIIK